MLISVYSRGLPNKKWCSPDLVGPFGLLRLPGFFPDITSMMRKLFRRLRKPRQTFLSKTHRSRLPAFASKANDLDALRTAVVDAASVSAGLWLSYLFVLFYLAIAAGSVTHGDLFFEKAVKLPFLNVELPLVAFFVAGPGLFLTVHAYVLLHFMLLADKAGNFRRQLEHQIADQRIQSALRRQLPSNIFVQYVAGPPEIRSGFLGFMFRSIADISLAFAPVALLVLFQLQFLPYHSESVSWWHRIAVVIDLALVWALWPSIVRGELSHLGVKNIRSLRVAAAAAVTVLTLQLVLGVATFPGEWLDKHMPSARVVPTNISGLWKHDIWPPVPPFHDAPEGTIETLYYFVMDRLDYVLDRVEARTPSELLVAGEVNVVTRKPTSLWSNRLVLPELDAANETASLRGRRLEGAILLAARMPGADFTGARLNGAYLDGADMRGAHLGCGADIVPREGGRPFRSTCTQLSGASLQGARLQGATLDGATLEDARLDKAFLLGASLRAANLKGASLQEAELQGAMLGNAQLELAQLRGARLNGAALFGARLDRADFTGAELQGVNFLAATASNASFTRALVWRADINKERFGGSRVDGPITSKKHRHSDWAPCDPEQLKQSLNCDWTDKSFEALKKKVTDEVPDGIRRRRALEQIEVLNPNAAFPQENEVAKTWERLALESP